MFVNSFKFRSILTTMILLVATTVVLDRVITNRANAGDTSRSVIVELQDDPGAVYKAKAERAGRTVTNEDLQSYRNSIHAGQDEFLKQLAARGVSFEVRSREIKNYDGSVAAKIDSRYTLVYNGIALNLPSSAISTLEAMPQVKKVHSNGMLYTQLNRSVEYINAPKVYGGNPAQNPNLVSQYDTYPGGFRGQGIYISVIDTGIDWTHPMFGGDPTPPRLGVAPEIAAVNTNKKVVYNLPLTDSHVGDGFGHGTHVASTAAGYLAQHPGSDGLPGTTDDIRLYGVAPQAKLMSYTVCSTVRSTPGSLLGVGVGGCEYADILTALEDSVSPFTLTFQPKPVAHVINMSLGGGGGPDNPTAIAASNAALTGTIVVASSGNSGPNEGTTGSPAAGTHVVSVAANTHPGGDPFWSTDVLQANTISATTLGAVTPAQNLATASGFDRLTLYPMAGVPNPPAGAMAQRYAFVNNPGATWPASVRGRIALVKSTGGVPTFAYASNMAAQSGAVGMILISATQNPTAVKGTIPSANISPAQGKILVDALLSNDDDTDSVDPPNGTVSELPIRMNPFLSNTFMGEMAGFSSRGPVRGLAQIKPDISAPGVAVLAAVPPASVLGPLALVLDGTANYMHLDGTSMSAPHVAGSVALIRQAHPDWTPDMIRTALINTATNMRDQSGTPKADNAADSINAQGGGLIDVQGAVNAKALMGVVGDGVNTPGILGSHSFGEIPVVNSRTTHTESVAVTVRDLSGQGGTYALRVVNNRELERNGVTVNLSSASVSVPASGSASYTVSATVDGDVIRDISQLIQLQWYVAAEGTDGGQALRSSFYMKPSRTLPTQPLVETQVIDDIMPAMDAGNTLVEGVTYKEYPVNLDSSALILEGTLEFLEVADSGVNDLDFYLFDPDGNQIGLSGVAGGPEYIKVVITRPGTYTWRVTGWANAPATQFKLTSTRTLGSAPPTLQAIAGDFTNAEGKPVSFDGSIDLSWQGAGGETGYEVEHSTNGTNYSVIASLNASQTSLALTDQPDGENFYRVRALTPGQIGSYVTSPSNSQSIIVDRRGKVDITALVSTAMSNVSFVGGVFKLDLNMKNNSSSTYVPLVELNVVKITSASGTVSVKNADNGGDGKTAATAALFGYSNLLGDEEFSPAETTGNRTLQFNDPAAEMFSFDIAVTAYQRLAGDAGATSSGGDSGGTSTSGSGGGSDPLLLLNTKVLRITVNPLTGSVTANLL